MKKQRTANPQLLKRFGRNFHCLDRYRNVVIVTRHRKVSYADGVERVFQALPTAASRSDDAGFVNPAYLNPRVREPAKRSLNSIHNVHMIEPIHYLPFVYLMKPASVVLADWGGVHEEAPSLGKSVIVMREHTERPEAIQAETAQSVGAYAQSIVQRVEGVLNEQLTSARMCNAHNPYGDGDAVRLILEVLATQYGRRDASGEPQ